jgi:hypothetical protein
LESGCSEGYDDLLDDVDLLLIGSEGRIGIAIVVKIEPRAQGEDTIQRAFIEVYEYNKDSQSRKKYGGRQDPYYTLSSQQLTSL